MLAVQGGSDRLWASRRRNSIHRVKGGFDTRWMQEPSGIGVHRVFATGIVEDTESEDAYVRKLDDELCTDELISVTECKRAERETRAVRTLT